MNPEDKRLTLDIYCETDVTGHPSVFAVGRVAEATANPDGITVFSSKIWMDFGIVPEASPFDIKKALREGFVQLGDRLTEMHDPLGLRLVGDATAHHIYRSVGRSSDLRVDGGFIRAVAAPFPIRKGEL